MAPPSHAPNTAADAPHPRNADAAAATADIWNPQPSDDPWITAWRWLCGFALVVFLGMQLTSGIVRWVLDLLGLAFLTYIPNVLMLGCVGAIVLYDVLTQRLRASTLAVCCLLLLSMVVGLVTTRNLSQVVFGAWVLTPFFFGMACAPVLLRQQYASRWLLLLFTGVAVTGVVMHNGIAFPWVGLSYSVGGVELEGAREWQTSAGNQRLSGFARSSFDVAGQIITAAALLSLHLPRVWQRLLLWVLCGYAISLATSKGIFLALFVTVLASEALLRNKPWWLLSTFLLGMLWLFIPPILGWTMDWSRIAHTDLENPLYGSFIDRMNGMWPEALELATTHGLPLLGRGIGGIGVALNIYEPNLANAGDNIFVYAIVLVGVLALPLFAVGFFLLIRLSKGQHTKDMQAALLLAVTINWYGAVSNILEHAILALSLGMVCRYLAHSLSSGGQEGG